MLKYKKKITNNDHKQATRDERRHTKLIIVLQKHLILNVALRDTQQILGRDRNMQKRQTRFIFVFVCWCLRSWPNIYCTCIYGPNVHTL